MNSTSNVSGNWLIESFYSEPVARRFDKYLSQVETARQSCLKIQNSSILEQYKKSISSPVIMNSTIENYDDDFCDLQKINSPEDILFKKTDLILFSDDFEGILPLNGIRHKEYIEIKKIIDEIASGHSKICIDPATLQKFQQSVLMDITILLTRALGRELIKQLLTRSDPLLVTSGHNQYNHEKHTLYLDKQSIGSHVTRLPTKDKEGFFTLTPRFTTLAHELIHAYHYQIFDSSLMEQLKGNPTLDINYHSLNEQLTICGYGIEGTPTEYVPINEGTIRASYGICSRSDHTPGASFPPNIAGNKPLWNGFIPLHTAAKIGALLHVKKWVQEGIPVNHLSDTLRTPLHIASAEEQQDIVDFLLENGGDVTSRDESGSTPLHAAAVTGNRAVCSSLVNHKADLSQKDAHGSTPLETAILFDRLEVISLLSQGASSEYLSSLITPPLTFRKTDICIELLKSGADANGKSIVGNHLHFASLLQNQEMIEALLQFGANPSATDVSGRTAFHIAAEKNNPELIACLHDKDPQGHLIRDNEGKSALELAEEKDLHEIVAIFKKLGDVQIK